MPNGAPGAGPPSGVDPTDLWTKITQLPRPVSEPFELRIRGATHRCVFQVLTSSELATVRATAEKAARTFLKEAGVEVDRDTNALAYQESYVQERGVALLAQACRDAGDPRFPMMPTAKAVRQALTDDEISLGLVGYNQFRREQAPTLGELTPAEMEAWVRVLQEGAGRLPLARLSGEALIDLVMYLGSKLPRSATGTSSPGSPPGGPSTAARSGSDESVVDASELAGVER